MDQMLCKVAKSNKYYLYLLQKQIFRLGENYIYRTKFLDLDLLFMYGFISFIYHYSIVIILLIKLSKYFINNKNIQNLIFIKIKISILFHNY